MSSQLKQTNANDEQQIPALLQNLVSLVDPSSQFLQAFLHTSQTSSIIQCIQITKLLLKQQQQTQQIILHTYQSATHLLDNLLLLEGIIQSNDKKLLNKAFEHFHTHLISLVQNLHEYPFAAANKSKKNNFMQRHLSIINDFNLDFKTQQQSVTKDLSFDGSKISKIDHIKQGSYTQFNTPNNNNVLSELEQAKMIIQDLNRYYEDKVKDLKIENRNMVKMYQNQKLKLLNAVRNLEEEIKDLRHEKMRLNIRMDQPKLQWRDSKETSFLNRHKSHSKLQFNYRQ